MRLQIGGIAFTETRHRVGDLDWVVLEAGAGRPLMCLHGFPDTPATFAAQAGPFIDAGYRLLLPYLPGYGPSTIKGGGDYYPGRFGEDLEALLDAMDIPRLSFLGHDWGGYGGLLLAAHAPARLDKLVSAAMPHLSGFSHAGLRQARRSHYIFRFQWPLLAERWLAARNFAAVEQLYRDWSPGLADPGAASAAVRDLLSRPGQTRNAIGYYRQSLRRGLFDRAQRELLAGAIEVPTLIVCGTEDGCIGPECFQGMEDSFPAGLALELMPGAGHFMHLESPEAFNRRVLDFLGA